MKNLILSAAFLAFAGLTTAKAKSVTTSLTPIILQDSTVKTPVKIEELPDAVKSTLTSDKYKEWVPTAAFLIKASNKSEWYQVDVKKAEETASLNIGKDGVVVE